MEEVWICDGCRSINRSASSRCYRCRSHRSAAGTVAMQVVSGGSVMTPGVAHEAQDLAWAMMAGRPYRAVWPLGFFLGPVLVAFGLLYAALMLGIPFLGRDVAASEPLRTAIGTSFSIFSFALFVLLAVFTGLTAMNAPALGAGTPASSGLAAALAWFEPVWYVVKLVATMGVPFVLYQLGRDGLGDVPFYWLAASAISLAASGLFFAVLFTHYSRIITRPIAVVRDLYGRYAVLGSTGGQITSYFAMGWTALTGAIVVPILAILIEFAWLAVAVLFAIGGRRLGGETEVGEIATALILVWIPIQAIGAVVAFTCLGWIVASLSRAARIRERWIVESAAKAAIGGIGAPQPPG